MRNKKNINYLLILTLIITTLNFNIINTKAVGTFDITVTPNTNGYGSVSLDWSNYNYSNKNFKVYKSTNGGTSYETVGIDYTSVNQVKCLQIYPISNASNQLKTWMETNGYGKGIIKVDSVSIENYNSNPYGYLKDSSGNWKYDVIFFGTWDSNNGKGLNTTSCAATEAFIKAGKGVIFGHDTISWDSTSGDPARSVYFNQLAKYVNITRNNFWANGQSNISSKVKITKKGLFTTYPWNIGDLNTILTIPQAHNVGQTANGDVWLRFTSQSAIPELNNGNHYLTTYNNCAMIQTGHSSGAATADEQKIIANLIFYMNQLLFNAYTINDNSAQDVAPPSIPTASDIGTTITFSTNDIGSTYQYYVESYSKDDTTSNGLIDRSTTKQIEVKTGLKSYRYIFDNSASTTVTLSNGTETTSTSVTQKSNMKYFHVAAVDNANNISATKTIELDPVWTLNTNSGIGGLISCDETIENGKSTSVHIVPMSGYQISTLTVDGSNVSPVLAYDFWNINKSHTISATFTKTTTLINYLNTLKTKYSWINL